MTCTYCMTSNCALAETCARYEDDAAKHLLTRSYADSQEYSGSEPISLTNRDRPGTE
jgi:hypothetical protein